MKHQPLLLRRAALLLGVVLLTALVGLVAIWFLTRPPVVSLPPGDDAIYGMVIRDPWYDFGTAPDEASAPNYAAQDRMGTMLAQLGVRWVRLEFHLEGGDLLVEEQLARYDYFIRQVAPRHNLKVLGLLGFGLVRGHDPRMLGQPTTLVDPHYGPGIDNPRRIWLDRARQIIDRYQGDVAAYQVLNEPNRLGAAWTDELPASAVARLQATLYTAVRHTDAAAAGDQRWRAQVQLILGGIQPAGSGPVTEFGHLVDSYYLRQLYAAQPFQDYHNEHGRFPLDGLGYHPYPHEIYRSVLPAGESSEERLHAFEEQQQAVLTPDPVRDIAVIQQRLDELRVVLAEVGDPQQPFWISEIGYNAGFGQQDAEVQRAFFDHFAREIAPRPDVARVFWFKYEDFPPASGPDAQQWGVVRIPFVPGGCPGGACYEPQGVPAWLRPTFFAYREQSGVADDLPEPPARIELRGIANGLVYRSQTVHASLLRPSAAQPISYTWQLDNTELVSRTGGLADTLTLDWERPGTYHLRVEAANAGGLIATTHTLRVYPCRCLPPLRAR